MLPSIASLAELASAQASDAASLWVLFFWAEFHPPSQPGGQMETLLTSLSSAYPTVKFAKVGPRLCVGLTPLRLPSNSRAYYVM